MRTLLAVASVALLVAGGFGCGDDTTTSSVSDMTAVADMSATPHDMMTLNCAQILSCSANCTTQACVGGCIAEGKSTSQGVVGQLLQCAEGACAADGGVDVNCVTQTVQASLTGAGPCASQGSACLADK